VEYKKKQRKYQRQAVQCRVCHSPLLAPTPKLNSALEALGIGASSKRHFKRFIGASIVYQCGECTLKGHTPLFNMQ